MAERPRRRRPARSAATVATLAADALRVRPLTAERWADFEDLFGDNGACGGCWCMNWRVPAGVFQRNKGAANRRALRALVAAGTVPGLLAYAGTQAVGWIAIEPRSAYPRLEASRILAPVDAQPVWSVSCFFVRRGWRGRGVSRVLLDAALAHARRRGARIVEGYPTEPRERTGDAFVWTGLASTFGQAGFHEVARRSPSRPIMRCAPARSPATADTR